MLSAYQIFSDTKENDLSSLARDRKLISADNSKSSGLKISTNINKGIKVNSDTVEKCKNQCSRPVKSCSEVELKMPENAIENAKKSEDKEEWPEIENMYVYDEPEDDYEDILPKNERFTRDDLFFFFRDDDVRRFDDEIEEEDLPNFILDDITDFYKSPSPLVPEECLYIDLPIEIIPIPSPPKCWD